MRETRGHRDTRLTGFRKISAVEGISVTGQMRREARTMSDNRQSDFYKK